MQCGCRTTRSPKIWVPSSSSPRRCLGLVSCFLSIAINIDASQGQIAACITVQGRKQHHFRARRYPTTPARIRWNTISLSVRTKLLWKIPLAICNLATMGCGLWCSPTVREFQWQPPLQKPVMSRSMIRPITSWGMSVWRASRSQTKTILRTILGGPSVGSGTLFRTTVLCPSSRCIWRKMPQAQTKGFSDPLLRHSRHT